MTRAEVIEALNYYGGKATMKQIDMYVGGYCAHVVRRMIKWKEVTWSHPDCYPKRIGGQGLIYTLVSTVSENLCTNK